MKSIKKYLITIMLLVAVLLTINTYVNAVGTVSLTASKTSLNPGDTFTISVKLSGGSVATLTSRITVDTSKIDYVSGPANTSFSGGRVIYTWTDPNGGASPITGTIATFTFRAKTVGSATFSVSGDFYTADEANLNPGFTGTSVIISEPAPPPTPAPTPTPSPTPSPPSSGRGN